MSSSALALVLAAGYSRRFGEDKRWVILHSGKPMLEQVLANLAAANVAAAVVLRTDDPHRDTHNWRVPTVAIAAEDAERGLGASIAAATRQIAGDQFVLICLGDMPFIKSTTYRAIVDCLMLADDTIVVPVYRGKRGHPVGFSPRYLAELHHLDGDVGARELLLRHRECVREVEVDDPGILRDIDTIADLLVGL